MSNDGTTNRASRRVFERRGWLGVYATTSESGYAALNAHRLRFLARYYKRAGRARMEREFVARNLYYPLPLDECPTEVLAMLVARATARVLPVVMSPTVVQMHPEHLAKLAALTDQVTYPATVEPVPDSPPLRLLDVQHAITAPRGPNTRSMTRSQATGRVVPLAA